MGAIEAVVFDLAGVVMESPLHSIAGYEQDHDLPAGTGIGVLGANMQRPMRWGGGRCWSAARVAIRSR